VQKYFINQIIYYFTLKNGIILQHKKQIQEKYSNYVLLHNCIYNKKNFYHKYVYKGECRYLLIAINVEL